MHRVVVIVLIFLGLRLCFSYFKPAGNIISVFGLSFFLVSSLKALQSNLLKIDCLPRIEKTKTKETIIKLKSYSFFRIFRIGILPYVSLHSFLNMFLHLFLFIKTTIEKYANLKITMFFGFETTKVES